MCAAKVDHKIVAIAFTYNNTPPTHPSPCRVDCSNKPKKCKQITTQIVTSTQKSFYFHSGAGQRCSRWEGGGRGCNAYATLSATVSGIAFSRCAADKCEVVFVAEANVIDWPLTVD